MEKIYYINYFGFEKQIIENEILVVQTNTIFGTKSSVMDKEFKISKDGQLFFVGTPALFKDIALDSGEYIVVYDGASFAFQIEVRNFIPNVQELGYLKSIHTINYLFEKIKNKCRDASDKYAQLQINNDNNASLCENILAVSQDLIATSDRQMKVLKKLNLTNSRAYTDIKLLDFTSAEKFVSNDGITLNTTNGTLHNSVLFREEKKPKQVNGSNFTVDGNSISFFFDDYVPLNHLKLDGTTSLTSKMPLYFTNCVFDTVNGKEELYESWFKFLNNNAFASDFSTEYIFSKKVARSITFTFAEQINPSNIIAEFNLNHFQTKGECVLDINFNELSGAVNIIVNQLANYHDLVYSYSLNEGSFTPISLVDDEAVVAFQNDNNKNMQLKIEYTAKTSTFTKESALTEVNEKYTYKDNNFCILRAGFVKENIKIAIGASLGSKLSAFFTNKNGIYYLNDTCLKIVDSISSTDTMLLFSQDDVEQITDLKIILSTNEKKLYFPMAIKQASILYEITEEIQKEIPENYFFYIFDIEIKTLGSV